MARAALQKRGIALILDYVPNHVAIDHVWTDSHTDYFLPGTPEELQKYPGAFTKRPAGIIAKGKDPNFEPWSDVVQLNAFSPSLRRAVAKTLTTISDQCDGVRCDMAMLMMNEVFTKTWGARAGDVPEQDYWPAIIAEVRRHNPAFLFLAEVYWHKERQLLSQGFDLCYDKKLYDHLVDGSVKKLKQNLNQSATFQDHLLRFIENHDEPQASATFTDEKLRAAAVLLATAQGAKLYHEGQLDGLRVRMPVHLGRKPVEPVDPELREFYTKLLDVARNMGAAKRKPCKVTNWLLPSRSVLAWHLTDESSSFLVIVNYSDKQAPCRLRLPKGTTKSGTSILGSKTPPPISDLLNGKRVTLEPWAYSIVRMR